MRFVVIPILILLVMCQSFSSWFVVLSFKLSQDFIAKNICENRYRPQLNCNGNCVLMKKLKQQEKEEQNSPNNVKLEFPAIVISSRSFFASIDYTAIVSSGIYPPLFNTGKPADRTLSVFRPPAA